MADGALVVALSRKYGKRLASYTLAMLCLANGCFFASTSFLPSSFSMYAMSFSSALFPFGNLAAAVSIAAAGVILGWPFSILAFLPVTVYSLFRRTFSLTNGYSSPLEIYKHLEHHDDAGTGSNLCIGSAWHRFPSSFFVPDYVSEVRWIDDGFRAPRSRKMHLPCKVAAAMTLSFSRE
ncbi:Dol-P-Man:Man(6) c(2)-PP-Dol alpha-1,2-mannosyltransferase [Olea europaea subsp. europaea]|uniref:Mannosyltransferase n=1 Tax=Olea europaea subsp. europaea TaxID=158383 RepID=A0A8S0R522_OLEEU|nr:Dol-P-Man:Man(6) c(2)-PP-Dol alpha-1,2-mannosyltransferase [Olea europaea subsp. europaea]